jgi:hypothetical protein
MKKTIHLLAVMLLVTTAAYAQKAAPDLTGPPALPFLSISLIEVSIPAEPAAPAYIEFDSATGFIWQFSLGETAATRSCAVINDYTAPEDEAGAFSGRFVLRQSGSAGTYILFDTVTGDLWQYTWNPNPEKSLFRKIDKYRPVTSSTAH